MTGYQPSASDTKLPLILSFCSFKGGVGKTTTCLNLAYRMAQSGQQVVVVDLDPLGAATEILAGSRDGARGSYDLLAGHGTRDGLSIPSRIENIAVLPSSPLLHLAEIEPGIQAITPSDLRRRVQSGMPGIDAILIDCGPGLGLIAVNAMAASDVVLIPVTLDPLALSGLERTLALIAEFDPNKPVQIVVGHGGEPNPALDTFRAELRQRFGNRVVNVRFRPLSQSRPQLAVAAS